jgi:hypothetical protein
MTSHDHDRAQLRAILECHGRNNDAWEAAGAAYFADPSEANRLIYEQAEKAFLASRRQVEAAEIEAVRRELRRIAENN